MWVMTLWWPYNLWNQRSVCTLALRQFASWLRPTILSLPVEDWGRPTMVRIWSSSINSYSLTNTITFVTQYKKRYYLRILSKGFQPSTQASSRNAAPHGRNEQGPQGFQPQLAVWRAENRAAKNGALPIRRRCRSAFHPRWSLGGESCRSLCFTYLVFYLQSRRGFPADIVCVIHTGCYDVRRLWQNWICFIL